MKKIILKIEGMTCSACSSSLEKYLLKQEGIDDALVNLVMSSASITYEDNITIEDLNRFVSEAGFKSLGLYNENEDKDNNKTKYFVVNGILALLVLYISMSHMIHLPVIPFLHMINYPVNYSVCLFIFSLYFIYFGRDIIISGIKNIKYKSPNMDTLVTLGVVSSFIFSTFNMIMILKGNNEYVENLYFESVCIILYLIKFGRYIDGISKEKTKDTIKGLVTITPNKAILFINNKEKKVSIDEVKKGDILIVKPGNRFAVDGVIVKGSTHVDESFISGESIPIKKSINDKVVAGSINLDGEVLYKAENIGRDSTISEIVRLVVEATNTKAPIARIADKVSGIFVPVVIFIALLTLIIHLILGSTFNESIILLEELMSKLIFQRYFDIVYLGQKIKCSIEFPSSNKIEVNKIDMTSTEVNQKTINLDVKICTNYPIIDLKTEINSSAIIQTFGVELDLEKHSDIVDTETININ